MSSEAIKQRKSFGSTIVSAASFPVGMAALNGVKSVIRNKGIANAVSSTYMDGFKTLDSNLRNLNVDCFSRGLTLSKQYDEYSRLAKTATNLANRVNKGTISFKDKIFNIFRKNKVTIDTIKQQSAEAESALSSAKEKLTSKELAEQLSATAKNGFGQNVGSLIKKGFKDPFVWAFTALETIPDIVGKIIPTFKEKGFKAGMKETGKTALKTGVNVATFVTSSAIGRAIGTAVGAFLFKGVGASACGNIGSMVAVSLGNLLKGKIFKPKEQVQTVPEQQQTPNIPQKQKTFVA